MTIEYCDHENQSLLETCMRREKAFPCGSDPRVWFSCTALNFFRNLTLTGKLSAHAFANTLKAVHEDKVAPSVYAHLLAASRKFRKLQFHLDTLRVFGMESKVTGCLACDDSAFIAMDGCFRLCRRKAAGKGRTEPTIKHFFMEPDITTRSNKQTDRGSECSQFRNTQQGRTRSRFKTLDETGE